ncbi:MAG: septation protein SepH [Actinomycetota bacterium]|nr:septation protein SepH [Actinomycetota bacterium]
MRYLQVTGIDGADLQLVDDDGEEFALPVTDLLRSSLATLRDQSDLGDLDSERGPNPGTDADSSGNRASASEDRALRPVAVPPATAFATAVTPAQQVRDVPMLPPGELVTPRAVQELLRAGHSVAHVAAAADWELAKVERYAAPIEAERSYIAGLVQDLPVGAASGHSASTVGDRIAARLQDRGVDAASVQWDASRRAGRGWVVVCRFSAGGRAREASWDFRPATRSLSPIDDEARWLGEDERSQGGSVQTPARPVKVFDVEAEGGVTESAEPVDLVSAMQARSRGRRARNRRVPPTRPHDGPISAELLDSHRTGDGSPADSTAGAGEGHDGGSDDATAEVNKPTVQELGHDPVTGTVDLFRAVPTGELPATAGADVSGSERDDDDLPAISSSNDPDSGTPNNDAAAEHDAQDEEQDEVVQDDVADTDHTAENPVQSEQSEQSEQAVPAAEPEAGERPTPPSRPGAARSGRPSVPSWDDIMFGGRRGRD